MEQTNNKPGPVHKIKYGYLEAAIWENKRREPGTNTVKATFHSVTLSRGYRSNGEMKNTNSFSRDDLLAVGKLCDEAYSWIHSQKADTSK